MLAIVLLLTGQFSWIDLRPVYAVELRGSAPEYGSVDGTYRIRPGDTINVGSAVFELQAVSPGRYVGELRYSNGARMRYQKQLPATNGNMWSFPYRGPPADPINGPPMIEWIGANGTNIGPSKWPGVRLIVQ